MKWLFGIALGFFVLAAVAAIGIGWAVTSGGALLARTAASGLEMVRAEVAASLPPGLDRQRIETEVDAAMQALREGQIDGAVLRETLAWLPGALLDGQLDKAETLALGEKLARIPGPGSGETPRASGA
jgi:autotransporter translocation and assembly factor TamB